ncbi:MAG TPA: PASTA domain-containing protein [Candidatus Hydrogenedentes bacterium]|nr:PASTA domain-containing protein [Candidatus Hydrogenedentota bacterium]
MSSHKVYTSCFYLVIAGLSVTGWPAPVTFNDSALLNAVTTQWEAATGLPLSDPPEDTELSNPLFSALNARNLSIGDLTGLEACSSLTELNLGQNQIVDLSPLAGLTNLVHLDVGFGSDPLQNPDEFDPMQTGTNLISDFSPLAGLVNLEYLNLMGNTGITSIAPISTMDSLTQLWIGSSPLTDFSPLLDVADTLMFLGDVNCGLQQSDLTIINSLTNLQGLGIIVEPAISDISGLTGLNLSIVLALMMVPVSDISIVASYTNLQMLQMTMTQVTVLPDLSGLTSLQEAGLDSNGLTDISGLAGLTSLQQLNLRNNAITDISALATCGAPRYLDLDYNQLTDIQPLLDNPGIANIQQLNISFNAFSPGTPFCDENQLDQLYTLAPEMRISQNAVCGEGANLTITVNGIGTTSPEPGVNFVPLNQYTMVNAFPLSESGQAFDQWTGDLNSTNMSESIYMDGDKSITANFVPGDWTLTINKTGASEGGTWPNPGVYSYLDGQISKVKLDYNIAFDAYFNGWSGDATGYGPSVQILMDGNKTVTADFTTTGYQLSLAVQGNGYFINFENLGTYKYATGATFDLQAQSMDFLHRFDHWEGNIGVGADPYNPVLPVTMDMNRTITAVFVEDSRTLTIIIDGSGSTDPEGSPAPGTQHAYLVGQNICIDALVSSETAFDHWSGDIGSAPPTPSSVCVIMDQDRTITAHFVQADWELTLQATGNGTTNPEPGVYGYVNGAEAHFSIQRIPGGDAFDQWTGDIDPSQPTDGDYMSVTMDRNRTITANFIPGDWDLTIATNGPAAGTHPNPGTYAYLDGRTAMVNAFNNTNSYFAGWTGDVNEDSPNITVLMDEDKSITANYASSGYMLTVNTEGEGWTSIFGTQYFASGMEPVVIASPSSGWIFSEWTGDLSAGADPNNPELPTLMDQDRSLTAHFTYQPAYLIIIIEGQGATTPAGGPDPGIQYSYPLGEQAGISADLGTDGWAFSHWSGDIGSADPQSRRITLTMDQDRTIVANYISADWTLTVAYTGNGSVWPESGSYGFVDGGEVEIVANILMGGDAFDRWDGLPEDVDAYDPGPRFQIHSDVNATAIFGPGDYTLTTTVTGGGSAEYVSHPSGVYQYMAGHYAHLEVRPNSSTYWGGFSGDLNTYEYFYRLLMDGNKNVSINLGSSGYELTVNQTGGGLTNPSGVARYMAGATPAIHAIDQGSILFDQWSGDLPPGMDPYDPDPIVLVDQDRILTANFVQANWYLYIQVSGNGITDPAPDLYWFLDGDPFDVTATPGADTLFLHWQGNVPEGQDPTSLTISGTMTQNRELIAVFVPTTVSVPDLSGMTQVEAEAALALTGLVLGTVTEEYSTTVPEGQIISQDPAASTVVAYGSEVSIVVSLGTCYTSVPDLTGLTQAEAEPTLAAANLTLGLVDEENSDIVPEGQIIRQQPVSGLVVVCESGVNIVVSLGPAEAACHTADQNCDTLVNLSELLRVIQFFNSGGYHCETGTEDGYAPGSGDTSCAAHASDYNPQDWQISLSELLRLIQFFNSGGYHPCEGSEDGFCPGPA